MEWLRTYYPVEHTGVLNLPAVAGIEEARCSRCAEEVLMALAGLRALGNVHEDELGHSLVCFRHIWMF